jgi:SAM-dependent methyltransferase
MLQRAYERLGPRVAVADAERVPVARAAVDTVFASWLLHLVGDAAAVLREAARVLRPGGRLLVVSSRGEVEHDDIEDVMVDLTEELRGRVDVRDRLGPLGEAAGLTLVDEVCTAPAVWEESPNQMAGNLEGRIFSVLLDLDDETFERVVAPMIRDLRALPDPDRARRRTGRHRIFVFEKR